MPTSYIPDSTWIAVIVATPTPVIVTSLLGRNVIPSVQFEVLLTNEKLANEPANPPNNILLVAVVNPEFEPFAVPWFNLL